jgi:16S rRNA (guanine527-N7)-methyltransferase
MDTARIAALLHPFLDRTLPEVQLQQISTYIDLLLRWNSRMNLTAIRDPEGIVTRHFGESLFLARHLFPNASVARPPSPPFPNAMPSSGGPEAQAVDPDRRALDIGSGAGFPGLPIKIWAPALHLTLVESNHKKATFLREVTRAITLTNVNVITTRAQTLVSTHPPADLVTLRAVERFETILPIAAALVAPTGRLALLISSSQLASLMTMTPGLHWSTPIPVPQSDLRVLSISVPH